jgi:hypothetical protein
MPITVVVGPSASPFSSIRMPPTFRCRCMRSFGHLSAIVAETLGLERAYCGDADGEREPGQKSRTLPRNSSRARR